MAATFEKKNLHEGRLLILFQKKSIYDDAKPQIKPGTFWSRLKMY